MKAVFLAVALLLTVLSQVTVSSLFPISGAVADLPLITLLLISVFAGPRAVMVGIPAVALMLGFVSDRSPGLLLIAYMPLLPLAALLEESRVPLNHYGRIVFTCLATGLWLRTVLALGAVAQGASLPVGTLVGAVLIPGAFLDIALLTVAYAPCRVVGWSGRGMTLRRSGW